MWSKLWTTKNSNKEEKKERTFGFIWNNLVFGRIEGEHRWISSSLFEFQFERHVSTLLRHFFNAGFNNIPLNETSLRQTAVSTVYVCEFLQTNYVAREHWFSIANRQRIHTHTQNPNTMTQFCHSVGSITSMNNTRMGFFPWQFQCKTERNHIHTHTQTHSK